MKIEQIKVKISLNQRVKDNFWILEFKSSSIALKAAPGQFVNLKVNFSSDPLLRRPISIHRVDSSRVQLFYEVLGPGTKILAQRKAGEFLDILGPLGNGFSYQKNLSQFAKTKSILIAGGMGVAPLVFLAQKLKKQRPLVLIGAQSRKQILGVQEFRKLNCQVKIATDDGTEGFKGRVTELLKLNLIDSKNLKLFACGPQPMLQELSQIAVNNNIDCQLSLEAHMACGIGACLGCVVETKSGYQRVCQEGPVFLASELTWGKK